MAILTPNQVSNILEIAQKYTLTYIATQVGETVLTSKEKKKLKEYGFKIPPNDRIQEAFILGMLSDAIGEENVRKISYKTLHNRVKTGSFIPFNEQEQGMLDYLRKDAKRGLVKLGQKTEEKIRDSIVNIEREAAIKTISKREGVQSMITELGKSSEMLERDVGRIAKTTLNNAFNEGRASIYRRKGGNDVRVYKDVRSNVCKWCSNLYLIGGHTPRIFKLSTLTANGTNEGRSKSEWKPVVGSTHPNCFCLNNSLPIGYDSSWIWDGVDWRKPKKQK